MSMEKLKCPTCEHYRLCSSAGEITDTQARTCKAYHMRKAPAPSMPRPIYGKIERYEYDVESGTISCKVIQTNADRIRSMTDEELADVLLTHKCKGCDWDGGFCGKGEIACRKEILLWLKQEVTE